MSGSAECRNQPPRGKGAKLQPLIGPATRSPERERKTRAFLLTMTYMDAGDSPATRWLHGFLLAELKGRSLRLAWRE
jgi:hypothetical protein